MKREQRNRNERGQLAVKIVCGAIASLLAGAFAASELFALSTRFSGSLGSHYFYLYPPWAIATWWSKWHTNAPGLFTQPSNGQICVGTGTFFASHFPSDKF